MLLLENFRVKHFESLIFRRIIMAHISMNERCVGFKKASFRAKTFPFTRPRSAVSNCLATDASLTADPGVASLIPAPGRSNTFMEIDYE